MKKRKIIIPRPRSKFILIRCPSCENEQVIFSHATSVVRCIVCDEILAKPTGGKAEVVAKKLKDLE